jgi:hypothetical protein
MDPDGLRFDSAGFRASIQDFVRGGERRDYMISLSGVTRTA